MVNCLIRQPYLCLCSGHPLQSQFNHIRQKICTLFSVKPKALSKDMAWHDITTSGGTLKEHPSLQELDFYDVYIPFNSVYIIQRALGRIHGEEAIVDIIMTQYFFNIQVVSRTRYRLNVSWLFLKWSFTLYVLQRRSSFP